MSTDGQSLGGETQRPFQLSDLPDEHAIQMDAEIDRLRHDTLSDAEATRLALRESVLERPGAEPKGKGDDLGGIGEVDESIATIEGILKARDNPAQ